MKTSTEKFFERMGWTKIDDDEPKGEEISNDANKGDDMGDDSNGGIL